MNDVPLGCWIASGILAWYIFAALLMRYCYTKWDYSITSEKAAKLWLLSPAVYPLYWGVCALIWFFEDFLIHPNRRS